MPVGPVAERARVGAAATLTGSATECPFDGPAGFVEAHRADPNPGMEDNPRAVLPRGALVRHGERECNRDQCDGDQRSCPERMRPDESVTVWEVIVTALCPSFSAAGNAP